MTYPRNLLNKTLLLLLILLPCLLSVINIKSEETLSCPVYSNGTPDGHLIALTFDDGPHPRITPKILNVLEKYNVDATFFVIGKNARAYPEVLEKIAKAGHEIGNHTDSHVILKSLEKEAIYKEINDCSRTIEDISNVKTKLIRPPCGEYDKCLVDFAKENDYKIILWNIDTNDWEHKSTWKIVSTVEKGLKGGDIILFHDYISGKANTVEALETLIPKLQSEGFEFVTVSELLK
jgi:polysaccharide deacetylase family sporulation protein PdaB